MEIVPDRKAETSASRLVEEIAAVEGVSRAALLGSSGRVMVDSGFPSGNGLLEVAALTVGTWDMGSALAEALVGTKASRIALYLEGVGRGPALALFRLPGGPDGSVPLLLLVATEAAIDGVASRLEDFSALRLSEADREGVVTRSGELGDSLLESLDRLLE